MPPEQTTAEERLARFRARVCATTHLRRVLLAHGDDADTEADIKSHKSALALLALALLSGKISRAAYIEKVTTLLHNGMVTAAERGGADKEQATKLADSILAGQEKRLHGFASELDDSTLGTDDEPGKGLSVAMSTLRAGMYAGSIWGAFQAGKTASAGTDTQWNWVCKDDKSSCETCQSYADGSPYSRADLPGYPGSADTDCGGNCRCKTEEA